MESRAGMKRREFLRTMSALGAGAGLDWQARNCVLGEGQADARGVLGELKRLGYRGLVTRMPSAAAAWSTALT